MSDTARDYQQLDPASTEGLAELFADHENHQESTDSRLILTVAEASVHLRKPISTIYRRVKAGKFETLQGDDGVLRIALPADNFNENQVITTFSIDEKQKSQLILIGSQGPESDNHSVNLAQAAELDRLIELLAEKDRKLEAATYRVGYLESRLEDRESQIKLLTDSQHKGGWWARFSSWFFGSR